MGVSGTRKVSQEELGFSLLGTLASVAIMGIVTLGILEVVKMSTSIQALSKANLHIEDQVFQLKMVLRNKQTCSLNLAGTSVGAAETSVVDGIRYLASDGVSLTSDSVVTNSHANVQLKSLSVQGNSHVNNLAHLVLSFESSGPGVSSFTRKLPLEVQLDTNKKIVSCSSEGLEGSGDITPPSNPKSNLPTCAPMAFKAWIGMYASYTADEAKSSVRKNIDKVCDQLIYPTPGENEVLQTKNAVLSSSGTGKESYGFNYLLENGPMFLRSSAANPPKYTAGRQFANLKTIDECKKIPEFPTGASLTTNGGSSTAGSSVYSNKYICIDGVWVESTSIPVTEAIPDGA